MSPKISVIIPMFNEERTILQVVDEVLTLLPQAHIAVFDNNSTDNSRNLVLEKIKSLQIDSQTHSQTSKIDIANIDFANIDFVMRGGGKQLFKSRI